jgi:2-keto-4-pentenoate hydratase/2-oxohepta-3-ene-1,7-dioic acid hydratase in catechol pathway
MGYKYTLYLREGKGPFVGDVDFDEGVVRELRWKETGKLVTSVFAVIEHADRNIERSKEGIDLSRIKLLAPLPGRDVLAVGKNYFDHAKEFNSSGFDGSDKVDIPSHPVIFTKRHTSIIGSGEQIYLHPEVTETVDYEGEIGVIIGKPAFKVSEQHAMDCVWGYTIINDVTAREKQRDHKQFFIGKSLDTFCPMGPVAVAKDDLPQTLHLETHVNGELRQSGSLNDLIFSIPNLIETLSAGITLQPGDIIATGTPAGVGIGFNPPTYLKNGDHIQISVPGLGTLFNVASSTHP